LTTIRDLNEAQFNALLAQANNVSEFRELLSPREQELTPDGYTAAISWVDFLSLQGGWRRVHFVLLVRNPTPTGLSSVRDMDGKASSNDIGM